MSLLDRIYGIMLSLRGGGIVPTALRLSQGTCDRLLREESLAVGAHKKPASAVQDLLGLPVEITEEQTDVIVAREIYPDRCPECGERIAAVPILLQRLQHQGYLRCSNGHAYTPQIREIYLNIFRQHAPPKTQKIEVCPVCGSKNIQHLSETDAFCLDCEWDNLKRI